MLDLSEWLALIRGVLMFPGELLALVRLFNGTSSEQRNKILASVQSEKERAETTGRPV